MLIQSQWPSWLCTIKYPRKRHWDWVKPIGMRVVWFYKRSQYIYIFIYFSDIHSTMSSQKWLTSHSKYKNASAGVGDIMARQARDVRRRRLYAGPTSTTLTHHRTSPDQTPLPDGKSGSVLHNHPHWGGTIWRPPAQCRWPNKSVYIFQRLFVNFNNYNNYNNYKHYCHKCMISISKQHE